MYSQDYPYVCPECEYLLDKKNIIEECDYPPELYRGLIKQGIAHKFECPKCFAISFLHKETKRG